MDLAALEQRARERRAQHQGSQATPAESPTADNEGNTMSDTKTDSAWGPLAAGVAGLLLGENGVLGKGNGGSNVPGVTPDQLGVALNNLQGSFQREQTQGMIAGLGAGNAIGFGAVKDAVTSASAANALGQCNLGHGMSAGFAAVNQTIVSTSAASRELALQQALDAERTRATELRIELSEHKNQAGHASTQVLVQQLVAKA